MQQWKESVMGVIDAKKGVSSKMMDRKKFRDLLGEIKQELKRIDWTSKEELKAYTKVVIACMFAFGFSIYFIDLTIRGCLSGINLLITWLVG